MMKIISIYCFICYTYYVRKFIYVSFALIYVVTSKFSAELPIPMSGGWRDPAFNQQSPSPFLETSNCCWLWWAGSGPARHALHGAAPHNTAWLGHNGGYIALVG